MTAAMPLTPTLEDYIEAIWHLVAEKGAARVGDIAEAVSVHKSTVSTALKSLSEKRLVDYAPYRAATLTPRGREVAREIVRRHEVMREFLAEVLCVPPGIADDNACRMEHAMTPEVLNRLALFIQFIRECPRAGEDWVQRFRAYVESGGNRQTNVDQAMEWVDHFKKTLEKKQEGGPVRMSTLDELKPGQKGKIVRIGSAGALKRRIVDMGVVPGTPVEVIKVAPLGDPVEIKVKGYNLTLRKDEAAAISVEPE